MGYVVYAILWLVAIGLSVVYLMQYLLGDAIWTPPLDAVVVTSLLALLLRPDEMQG